MREIAEVGELPAPSPELVLIGVFVRAYLRTCDRKPADRREAFLADVEATFELFEREQKVPRLRSAATRRAVMEAKAQAAEWYSEMLPVLAG